LPSRLEPAITALSQQLAQQILANIFQNTIPGLQDLKQGVPLWVASLKARHQSPRTIQGYEADVSNYLKHDSNPTSLSIQGYIAQRLDEVSPARVSGERKALTSFFRFLNKNSLVSEDPTAKLDSFKVTYKERELPSQHDIEVLLSSECFHRTNTSKFRTMTLLLANTGMRLGEACSIKKVDINFNRLEIKVIGKGRKQRVVPISDYVARTLKAWIEQDGQSKWLFPADSPAGFWDERSYEKTFKRQCKRYDIKPFTPHALRHFFATHSLRNGARLEVISRLLGHASIAVTADIYTHIDEEEIHDTHKKFAPFTILKMGV